MATETSTAASAGRSGGGGASADSYIGSLITLTSKSEIRYEGVLLNINTEESSIGLRNVRSFGTEGRKKDGPQLPPSDRIYEYILFRGTDIKDLQVKASPPVQTTPPINSDPAIIQSHYPHPTTPHTGLATAPIGSFADIGSPSAQMGIPGPTFQSGPPLYQPGGNMNSWVPSPSNATGNVLPMPMYWQGYYNPPNGLPQAPQPPQQSFPRPPIGLSIPPSMQQMQLSALNSSLPTSASSLPGSILPDHHSSFLHNNTSSSNLVSASLPASTLSLNVPPLQPVSLASEVMTNLLPNKAPLSTIPTSTPSSGLPSLPPFSVHDNVGTTSFNGKSIIPGPAALPQQNIIQPVTSAVETSGSDLTETPIPSLLTPGHLLQCGPSAASTLQPLQTTQKDVEVVQVSPKLSDPSASTVTEAQPPILPLPPNARAHKSNGGSYHMHNNYRGRGGRRGSGNQRPLMKFTEDFDFMAMNEKFNKDEVWGHLGKSNRSQSKDKEVNFSGSDEDEQEYEDDVELPKIEIQPVYNKDDFFDSLSCNALDNDPNRGRPKYSEQMKLDTETFGEFSRFRGGRGGRGFGRVGGRFHGHSYGRGNGGYGYPSRGRGWSRGRGQSMQSRAS